MRARWAVALLLGTAAGAQVNPVSNGGFETLADNGLAVDWEHVGRTVSYSDAAHGGVRSMRLVRTAGQTGETGFNRGWHAGGGEGGAMLTELKGALVFWYRIESLDAQDQIQLGAIPMNDEPLENTGSSRRMVTLPRKYVGDGQWHRAIAAYDYTEFPAVKWVHVSGRIVGSGGGEVLIDDISWMPEAGPLPMVQRLRVVPQLGGDRYRDGALLVTFHNAGDQPCGPVEVTLGLPEGWQAGEPRGNLSGLGPDEYRNVEYPLSGQRHGESTVTVTARAGEMVSDESLAVKPELRLFAVLAKPVLPAPGEAVEFQAVVDNKGLGEPELRLACEAVGFEPDGQRELPVAVDENDPARWRSRWSLKALAGPRHEVRVRLYDGPREVTAQTIQVRVDRAAKGEYQPVGGALEAASSPDGATGRIVADGQVLAVLPHLGRVVYRLGDRERQVSPTTFKITGNTLASTVRDPDGGTWRFELVAAPGPTNRLTRLETHVSCDRPRRVTAVYGPDLYAPGERGEALYPGLEWLAPGELSSNDRDIADDEPLFLRLTTHPNNVTIPLMTAVTDRGVVGLLWDAHERWYGDLDRPQPVFASPDRFTGVDATRMGLMAPNTLNGLAENALTAEQPLDLPAGRAVSLSAHVYHAAGAGSVLDVLPAWFSVYQPEPILDYPRGSVTGELALSARAYLDSLWDEEEGGWWPFLGGPAIWRKIHRSPQYCFDLLQLAALMPEHALAPVARQRAERILEQTHALPTSGDDLGYYAHDPIDGTRARLLAAAGQLASREADGGWSYHPPLQNDGVFKGADYYELGEPGMTGNGLFANRIRDVLEGARLAGDWVTYQDCLPSLERLAQFTIPRAAQVWEVPVHTPDILAAAHATSAFLAAYAMSGEQRWLDEAKRQAVTGLPFIYVWNEHDKPWMRYGSIPVFGATWFRGAWFGRLVQWNGLDYALALQQLAQFDPDTRWGGLSWDDLARGIMVSGMYQQREDDGYWGLWPDALGCRDETRANWEFAPRRILELLYHYLGRVEKPQVAYLLEGDRSPRLVAAGQPDQRLTIAACAQILAGTWQGDELRVTFGQPAAPAAVRATAAGIGEPTAVLVDGREVAPRDALEGVAEPCYRWDAETATLAVVLTAAERCEVTVRGAKAQRAAWRPDVTERIAFDFDTGLEGWNAAHDLRPMRVANGILHAETTGADPYMVRLACHIAPDTVKTIHLRYRFSAGPGGQWFWTTEAEPQWDEAKSLHFPAQAGDQWQDIRLPVGENDRWRGQTITAIRFDPATVMGPVEVEIDFIRGE